jgi:hypothetical protein
MKKTTGQLYRFEQAKAKIMAAAMSPTTKIGDTFVTASDVANFTGLNRRSVYIYRRRYHVPTIKDNNRKSDNGQGMLAISRKIPVTEVGNFVRTTGTHKTLGVKASKAMKKIIPVLEFIDEVSFA